VTRPLTTPIRQALDQADDASAWSGVDPETMLMSVESLRESYPMSDIRLAQFLMEVVMSIDGIIAGPPEELAQSLRGYRVSLVLLASAVSRRARGKPEIRVPAK
jgi:hypothetical protein